MSWSHILNLLKGGCIQFQARGYRNSSVKKVRINKQPGRFLRNECLFFHGSLRRNRSAGQTLLRGSRAICLFRATIHSPWTQKKSHSILMFTILPTKALTKILRETLSIQNFHSYGNLTSFYVNNHCAYELSNSRTTCWQWFSGITLKKFWQGSTNEIMYDTIANISMIYRWRRNKEHVKND